MDELFFLILLNISIGFGSYIAGTIPILIFLSESRMRLFSVFGAGILMGTALCVIIPEGINSIYETSSNLEHINNSNSSNVKSDKTNPFDSDPHSIIGLTLLFGFVIMLLVDQISAGTSSNAHYNQLTSDNYNVESGVEIKDSTRRNTSKMTATIGLIVHSAADGIALGAAATTSHADVEMIVFLAIMLHKAPAAFGLVTFLLHEGLDRSRIKRHLIMFSSSAPIAAFITYFGISSSTQETLLNYNATGISLLFSAGTFLYVAAVHVLPEITQHRKLKIKELFLLIIGSFLPSILTIKHHH